MGNQIGPQRLDIGGERLGLAKGAHQPRHRRLDRDRGHPGVQPGHRLALFAAQFGQGREEILQLLMDGADVGLDLGALGLGQGGHRLGLDDLAVAHGGQRKAHGRAQDRHLAFTRAGGQRVKGRLVAGGEFLFQGGAAVLVILGNQQRGDARGQILDQRGHCGAQLRPLTGRQADRQRAVGIAEVLHIDPVLRQGAAHGLFLQDAQHGRMAAAALGAMDKEVEAPVPHAGRKADRLNRAVLTGGAGQGLQRRRRLEGQGGGIADRPQLRHIDRRVDHSAPSLCRPLPAERRQRPASTSWVISISPRRRRP